MKDIGRTLVSKALIAERSGYVHLTINPVLVFYLPPVETK